MTNVKGPFVDFLARADKAKMIDFTFLINTAMGLEDALHPAGFAGRDTFPTFGSAPWVNKSPTFMLVVQAVACVS